MAQLQEAADHQYGDQIKGLIAERDHWKRRTEDAVANANTRLEMMRIYLAAFNRVTDRNAILTDALRPFADFGAALSLEGHKYDVKVALDAEMDGRYSAPDLDEPKGDLAND